MIRSLATTLAPFVECEKPELSPALGADFTKNRSCISRLRINRARRVVRQANMRGWWVCGFARFYWLFATFRYLARRKRRVRRATSDAPVHQRYDAAQMGSRPEPAV
jgi:hypothetical protein